MKNKTKSELEKELVKLQQRIIELEKSDTQGKLAELENILNTSPIHIASININGKYTSWNRASEDMFGFTAEEVIGKLTPGRFHRNDKEAKAVIDTVEREGRFDDEITFVRRDGSEFHARLLVSKTIDTSGNHIGYTGVAVDISERKQAEKIQSVLYYIANSVNTTTNLDELYKIIHRQLGKIIDTTNFYIANYNENTGEIIASYFIDEMFDVKPPIKLRTKGFTAYVIRNKKSVFLTEEKRKKLIELGEIVKRDWKSKIWLGVPLVIENRVVGALAVMSYRQESLYTKKDLSLLEFVADAIALVIARKQAEQELEQINKVLKQERHMHFSGPVVVFKWQNKEGWPVEYVSPNVEDVFGYSVEELLSGKILYAEIIPKEDIDRVSNEVATHSESGVENFEHKPYRIIRKDRKTIWIADYTTILRDEAGKITHYLGYVVDITERKQAEKIQSVLYNIANAVNTTKDLDELYYTIHHLLNDVIDNTNFYIALFDEDKNIISFPYYFDEKDPKPEPVPQKLSKGLTEYVIRTGKSLLATKEYFIKLTKEGEIEIVGSIPEVWLGIPLRIGKKTIGVMALQSYKNASIYNEKDVEILELVSYQIAVAIERKQVEEALIENEEKYHTLIDNIQDGVFLIQDGLMKLVNPAFASMIGYNVKEVIGMDFRKLVAPEDVEMVTERYRRRQAGEDIPSKYEFRMLCKDRKTRVDVFMSIGIIKFKGKVASIGTIHDITKRKQSGKELEKLYRKSEESRKSMLSILEDVSEKENELRKSEERFQDVVTNTGDWIWEIDKEGCYTYCSPVVKQVLGYEYKEVLGKYFYDFFIPDKKEEMKKAALKTFAQKRPFMNFINRNIHKDGREVILETNGIPLFNENGDLVGYRGVDRDITERVQSGKIQKTLYNISNAINTTDNMHLLCQKVREFLGNVIDTKNFYIALYDEKTDVISLPFEVDEKDKYESFQAGKTLTKYVIQLEKPLFAPRKLQDELTKQGKIEVIGTPSEIWLGAPLKVENSVIGVIAVQSYDDPSLYTEKDIDILTFISEEIALAIKHKQAEEQIKKELKEKVVLLREVHHRVKNNLQVISGLLQLQQDEITTKENAIKGFAASQDRILAMAKAYELLLGSEYMSDVSVGKYIESLAEQLKYNYDTHRKVQISYSLEELTISIEILDRLGLILNEIITNSIKYAFEGRELGNIHIELKETEKHVVIKISDDGIGMPEGIDIHNHDTLGLSLVDMLITQLRGIISLDRKNGTSYTLKIPKKLDEN